MLPPKSKPGTRKLKRRWLQFSLRSLLMFVLLCALMLSAWTAYLAPFYRQKWAVERLRSIGAKIETEAVGGHRWGDRLIGEKNLVIVRTVILRGSNYREGFSSVVDGIADLPWLRKLSLAESPISDADLQCVAGLSELDSLDLRNTALAGEGLRHLRGCSNLRALCLNDTATSDTALLHLAQLSGLEVLSLSRTRITDAGLAHLRGLANLTVLDLAGTQVSDAGLVHLGQLTRLRRLDLGETRVTGGGLEYLKFLPNLSYLDLRRTDVTDAALITLAEFPCLNFLDVGHTKVAEVGVSRLRHACPKIRISVVQSSGSQSR